MPVIITKRYLALDHTSQHCTGDVQVSCMMPYVDFIFYDLEVPIHIILNEDY